MKLNPFNTSGLFLRGIPLLLLSFTLFAASAQKVNVEVAEIYDNRLSSRLVAEPASTLVISIEVAGLVTDARRLLKVGSVTRAVDNLGNSLQTDESSYYTYNDHTILNLQFRSSERKATEISVLEGTLKYFTPTVANKGLLNVDKPVDKLGTNILKGKYSDITMVLLDRKKLQKIKAENDKAYKQQLDKLKKEYGPAAESIQELNEILEDPYFGSDDEIFFFFYDPKAQVKTMMVFDAEGNHINYGGTTTGNHVSFPLQESTLDNTMKIELVIETPQAVKEYPFALKNIILP